MIPVARPLSVLSRLLCASALTLGLGVPSVAQTTPDPATAEEETANAGPVMLVADSVFLDGQDTLVATGNVEALQGETRITAHSITYDRGADLLTIKGPITITQGARIVVLADAAEMDPQFRNGLLTGARMVLDQQVQLAALQINRVNGRYSQLYKASVTTCRVCEPGARPLWQIRARRVIHDQQERQLYFHGAQFRILDVPVFYFPRLRLPDPSLTRATGFLIPSLSRNSLLGSGVKIPYFIRLGDHRDLTVTPYLGQNTRTLELRYRQAFRNGSIEFEGAVSQDSLVSGANRAYLFGEGAFDLRNDFKLTFNLESVNDDAYLVDYDYSSDDRLQSQIALTRVRRDEYINGEVNYYHSIRAGEDGSTLPSIITDLEYERRYFPASMGGELRASASLHNHFRYSNTTTDGTDVNIYADGLDVTRLNATVDWRRTWTLAGGIRAGVLAGVAFDQFSNNDGGTTVPGAAFQATPMAALNFRWPWRKTTARGGTHIIEPMVQLGYTGGDRLTVANDESTRVEFDEGNLLSLSRYPAYDRRERGLAGAFGLSWTQYTPKGWQSSLTLGQVIRDTADADFTLSSGLQGTRSDVLVAGQLKSPTGLSLTARTLFDSAGSLTKGEARGTWQNQKLALGASYVWLGPDVAESRTNTISEWSIDGLYRINRHWSGSAEIRYDVVSAKTAEAGIGLQYRNECVQVDLSLSRRFTSSIILTPSTDLSLTVGLQGFSATSGDKSYVRTCRK